MEKATKITLTTVSEKAGLLGRRFQTHETLTLHYPGGKVILSQRALEETGDSWSLFCRRLEEKAREQGIPWEM